MLDDTFHGKTSEFLNLFFNNIIFFPVKGPNSRIIKFIYLSVMCGLFGF